MTRQIKIKVENVYKIFGPRPEEALSLVKGGMGKTELLQETEHVLGIRDVSLDIPEAQTFVIMGLSGSGKSTLIRHFNRLIEPTSGRILYDGEDILALTEAELRSFRRSKISMVFQRFALLPHKTVLENTIYGLVIAGMEASKARKRGLEQIEIVGLSGYENRYPRQLSGGMQQRVGLARALASDAEVLLMDEAFSALDPLIRNEMQELLKELQSRLHKTIVFITHDLDEALNIGDTIAILKDGELRQVGSGTEILLNPADEYVERFVRDVNRARVVLANSIGSSCPVLDIAAATSDMCLNLIKQNGFVLLARSGKAPAVITSRMAVSAKLEDLLRQPDQLPAACLLSNETTLEDCFPILRNATGPLVTSLDQMTARTVTGPQIFQALARQ